MLCTLLRRMWIDWTRRGLGEYGAIGSDIGVSIKTGFKEKLAVNSMLFSATPKGLALPHCSLLVIFDLWRLRCMIEQVQLMMNLPNLKERLPGLRILSLLQPSEEAKQIDHPLIGCTRPLTRLYLVPASEGCMAPAAAPACSKQR